MSSTIQSSSSYTINREHINRPYHSFTSPPKLWLIENKFTNYVVWRAHVHDMFKRDDQFGFIDGTETEPLKSVPSGNGVRLENPEYSNWRKSDERAKERLLSLLDHDIIVPSNDDDQYKSCRDIWVHLRERFRPLVTRTEEEKKWSTSGVYEAAVDAGSPSGDYMKLHEAALSGDWWAVKHLFENDVGEMVRNDVGATPICDDKRRNVHQNPDEFVGVGVGGSSISSSSSVFPQHTAHIYAAQDEYVRHYLFFKSRDYSERSPFVDTARLVLLISTIDAGDFYGATVYSGLRQWVPTKDGMKGEYLKGATHLSGLKVSNKSALTCLASNQMLSKRQRVDSYYFPQALPFSGVNAILLFMLEPMRVYISKVDGDKAWTRRVFVLVFFISGLIITICCIPLILLNTLYWLPWKFLKTLDFVEKTSKEKFIDFYAIELLDQLCENMKDLPGTSEEIFGEAFLLATQLGANVVIERILTYFPEAAFYWDPKSSQYIIHKAVESRDQYLFAIIYKEFGRDNFMRIPLHIQDCNGNNILHLAAKLSPPSVLDKIPGSVLQLQQELKWFKEMENILSPHHQVRLNNDRKTPKTIFTEEHKDLKDKAEKWMKDTSISCTIIAALIGTIMFAASITVPGGNDQNTGFPMFRQNPAFRLFAIFDGIAFLTSVVSLVMFMEIMMARYEVEDFIRQLPVRLFIGLGSLIISIFFMMLSCCFAVDLVFGQPRKWVLISVVTVSSNVLLLFGYLQGSFLFEMIGSTYSGSFIGVHRIKNPEQYQQYDPSEDPLDIV